ncbi:MAG: cation diffusion facilitator family transporter [Oscillospiraceae bacterium]|nr:cation diffusion facilitator family transporter [Oscillospiraceae bacterium]
MLKKMIRNVVQNGDAVNDISVRHSYGIFCGISGILLNTLLFFGKYFASVITGSVAILADAFNNLTDAGSSCITLLGFLLARKKRSKAPSFDSGKYEYYGSLLIAAAIILTGILLVIRSVQRILTPTEVQSTFLSCMILVVGILVKLFMALYNNGIGKKIGSAAMEATAADSISDAVIAAIVLMSTIVSALLHLPIDGYASLAVSLFITYSGLYALRDAVAPLLGQLPDPDIANQVRSIVLSHPEILNIHNLIIHDYGPGRLVVSLHAEVPGNGNIYRLHDAVDSAENELRETLGCLATVHMAPIDTDDNRVSAALTFLTDKLRAEVCADLSIRDLRLIPGTTHTVIVFDAMIPADASYEEEELRSRICQVILASMPNCYPEVTIVRAAS